MADSNRVWAWIRSSEPDQWLHRHRSFVTGVFLVVIFLQVLDLFAILARVPGYPSQWVPLSVVSRVELLLATGTLALAWAALTQAVSAGAQAASAKAQADSAERKREADLRPHLDLQVITGPRGAVYWDLFKLDEDRSVFYLRLRNLGPGNAVRVHLTGYDWIVDTSAPSAALSELQKGGPLRGPLTTDSSMIPKDVVGGMIALAVNESFEVPYQFRIPPLADHPALVGNPPPTPPPSTAYCEQILFVASCQDVEGKPGDELRMGLRAQILVPSATPAGKAARNFTSLWRRLPESETAKIPVPRH